MTTSIYIALPLMLLLAIVQAAVLPGLTLLGPVPQLPFLVALSWGLLRGTEQGIFWAFLGGIAVGLFSVLPLGLAALAYMAGVGVALLLIRFLPQRRLSVAILLAALGSLVYLIVYFIGLRIFGHGGSGDILYDLLPLVALHALLIVPVYLLMSAIERATRPRRVEL